ncbi:MAG TPA: glutaredoxin [Actinomycetota bacterium]|nr:glutaredoxin [Actinomycetota bacterium]
MSSGNNQRTTRLTLVTAPGCHFCEDAHRTVKSLIEHGTPLELEVVEATSPAGFALLAEHRPAMNPLILIDGTYFSAGRLPRRKLQALLAERATRPGPVVASHG